MQMTLHSSDIWISTSPIDFRKSIDGLCAVIVDFFDKQPQEGLYIFYNRTRDKLKILGWHHNGFVLVYKRLEKGRFYITKDIDGMVLLEKEQLSWLLAGLDWVSMREWDELKFSDFS